MKAQAVSSSVNELLDKARIAYVNALNECKEEYEAEELTKAFNIGDPM